MGMKDGRWMVDQKTQEVKQRLNQILSARGAVSQASQAAQVHRTTVSNWKMPTRDSMPDLVEAGLICERFGISLDQLYKGLPSKVGEEQVPEKVGDIVLMLLQVDDHVLEMIRRMLNGAILMDSFQAGNGPE